MKKRAGQEKVRGFPTFEEGWSRGTARLLIGNREISSATCRLIEEAKKNVVVTMFEIHNRETALRYGSLFKGERDKNVGRIMNALLRSSDKEIYLLLDRINEPIESNGIEPGSYLERLGKARHIKIFYDRAFDCPPGQKMLSPLYPAMGRLLDRMFKSLRNDRFRRLCRLFDLATYRGNHKKLLTIDFGTSALISSHNWCDTDGFNSNSGVLYSGLEARRSFEYQLKDDQEFSRQFSQGTKKRDARKTRWSLSRGRKKECLLKYVDTRELRRSADLFFESIAPGDRVSLACNVFYDPRLIQIIKKKAAEGASFRILLDEKVEYFGIRCPHLLNYLAWRELRRVKNVSVRFLRRPGAVGEMHEKAILIQKAKPSPSLAWVGCANLTTLVLDRLSLRDSALLVANVEFVDRYEKHIDALWRSEGAYSFRPAPRWWTRQYEYLFNLAAYHLGLMPV
jgi:phospholipase D-like protein